MTFEDCARMSEISDETAGSTVTDDLSDFSEGWGGNVGWR